MLKSLILQLNPLHQILLLAVHLDMLLADELEEFAHLFNCRFFALSVILTARAIFVVLFLFRVEDVLDDGL